jgi:hypothetical protein
MNKEDIWISRVPTPIKYQVDGNINDDFENMKTGKSIINWNTYSPQWAPVDLVLEDDANTCIQLKDEDPYDYARAIRIFEESNQAEIAFKIKPQQITEEPFEVDVVDRYGNRPVRISINNQGEITASDGSEIKTIDTFRANRWIQFKIVIDAHPYGNYSIWIDGKKVASEFLLAEAVKSVERVSFRTGPYRDIPNRKTPNETPGPPLPGADDPVFESVFLIDDFKATRIH